LSAEQRMRELTPKYFSQQLLFPILGHDQDWRHNPEYDYAANPFQYDNLPPNGVVAVRTNNLYSFEKVILPRLEQRNVSFFLVVWGTDRSPVHHPFFFQAAQHRLVLHQWIVNYENGLPHTDKVSPFPIGVTYENFYDCHFTLPASAVSLLRPSTWVQPGISIRQRDQQIDSARAAAPPTLARQLSAFADFHFNRKFSSSAYAQNRSEVYDRLKSNPLVHFQAGRKSWADNALLKTKHAFDISVVGVGADCYRTWEAILLGMIVITQRPRLGPGQESFEQFLYRDMPVVLVDDWAEVTEVNLLRWRTEMVQRFGDNIAHNSTVQDRLTAKYWKRKFSHPPSANQHIWEEQSAAGL